jgi:hypothetical protein
MHMHSYLKYFRKKFCGSDQFCTQGLLLGRQKKKKNNLDYPANTLHSSVDAMKF